MALDEIKTADDLAAFAEERCGRHWSKTRQALLLTTLGTEALALMEDKSFLKKLGGIKSFIEKNVSALKVITHGTATGKHGVVPASADIPENTDFLFTAGISTTTSAQQNVRISYHSGFWKAFKNPVVPGHARVWSSETPNTYSDIPMGQPIPKHSLEIPERFILGIEGPLGPINAQKLRDCIRKYIAERELDEAHFIYEPTAKEAGSRPTTSDVGQKADFAYALSRLSKSDQSRISIPLDIVIEMFRTR